MLYKFFEHSVNNLRFAGTTRGRRTSTTSSRTSPSPSTPSPTTASNSSTSVGRRETKSDSIPRSDLPDSLASHNRARESFVRVRGSRVRWYASGEWLFSIVLNPVKVATFRYAHTPPSWVWATFNSISRFFFSFCPYWSNGFAFLSWDSFRL